MTSKEALDTIYGFAMFGVNDTIDLDLIRKCYNIIMDNLKEGKNENN